MNSDIFLKNREYWKDEIIRGNLIWPDTSIIKFVNRNFKKELRGDITVLDFGCGAGRNSIALAEEGFNVIAMDYNEEGLELLKQKSEKNIKCIVNEGIDISLKKESIDVIVASGSLMYCNKEERIQLLKNLKDVLKVGGIFWSDWRSKEDYLYGMGECIEEGYYLLNNNSRGRNGVTYYFTDKNELKNLYEQVGLNIISIDKYSYTEDNENINNSWYHVVAKR